MRAPSPIFVALVAAVAASACASTSVAADWPSWRGPEQCGLSRETGLPESWSPEGERTNVVWHQRIGCRSTPVEWSGRLYLVHLTGDQVTWQEEVVCFDADTGSVLWRYPFDLFLTDVPSTRVGWANPCVDPETGNVYVHGVQGLLLCLDPAGKLLWQRSLTEEYGRISGYGGRTHTPLIDEDRVVISILSSSWGSHAKGSHRYLALDKHTGEALWWSEPGGAPLETTYSTPVVAVVDGVRLLIGGNGDGNIYALKARTGERVWTFRLSKRGINASVVYKDGLVYACHSEENQVDVDPAQPTMGRVVCVRASGKGDITATHEVWRFDALTAGYATPACDDRFLYVGDNSANVHCFDLKSGKRYWVHNVGTTLKASPVVADGKLYIGEVSGRFSILKLRGEEAPELLSKSEFSLPDGRPVEINGSACVARGKVYLTTFFDTFCVGRREATASVARGSAGGSDATAEFPAEAAVDPNAPPAHLAIVPAEVALTPASSASFRARLFDENGRFLRECAPEWSLEGLQAAIDPQGRLAVAADSSFQGGTVNAVFGGRKASARVRVVPAMPLRVDFESIAVGSTPPGWVGGTPVKFQVVDIDGSRALKKLPENPRFIDARAFIGLPTAKGYTIQADVMGTEAKLQMPDIGLFNCRYRFEILGNRQKARILAWEPMPRLEVIQSFHWEPKVWYTLKFRVDGDQGLVRAKVWKRGEPEPGAWLLEASDPVPMRNGAPGLYGYSAGATEKKPGAAIFYDNVLVTANQ